MWRHHTPLSTSKKQLGEVFSAHTVHTKQYGRVGGHARIGEAAAAIPVVESAPPGPAGLALGGVTQCQSEDWRMLGMLGREGGEITDCVEIHGQLGF
ncbi:hypothetical protein OUZ56_009867 [Daphnia magna]|uniref:Uncharacterized protein n=1 Tax=Daphnia magna TaxID=35525 RepID=A0ABR0AH88_9CRUS|nr:hypothetical protein OUZ56_009867 [Daphnia magna]